MPAISLKSVQGVFFRAVDPAFRDAALAGSRGAGRYSRPGQSTLYLSASRAGVTAAMAAYRAEKRDLVTLGFRVTASDICDLRDGEALLRAGLDPMAGATAWRACLRQGGSPPSWALRDRLERLGARGLIDPSRNAPGLWHLVLFAWNQPGTAQVSPLDPAGDTAWR